MKVQCRATFEEPRRLRANAGFLLIVAGAFAAPLAHSADPDPYSPPQRGAPRSTTSSGIAAGPAPPRIQLLTLESVVETAEQRPTLFWHIDSVPPRRAEIAFHLVDPAEAEPLVAARLPVPTAAGLQALDLDAFGEQLEPGRLYEWSISLRLDPSASDASRRELGFVRYRPADGGAASQATSGICDSVSELHRALLAARRIARVADATGSLFDSSDAGEKSATRSQASSLR